MKRNMYFLFLTVSIALAVAVWNNGIQGQDIAGEQGIQSLKDVLMQIAAEKMDEGNMPYSISVNHKGDSIHRNFLSVHDKSPKRIVPHEDVQTLYPMFPVGNIMHAAYRSDAFLLEKIYDRWQKDMQKSDLYMDSALSLQVYPSRGSVMEKSFAGDVVIGTHPNKIGTYRMDDTYTMLLTVYLRPDFWSCIDWGQPYTLLLICLVCILSGSLIVGRLLLSKKKHSSDVYNYCFDGYEFDVVQHTLTYNKELVFCTNQSSRLLHAFLSAPGHFLSNDDIASICDWKSDKHRLNERRRTAINSLRKLFKTTNSIQIHFIKSRDGYLFSYNDER